MPEDIEKLKKELEKCKADKDMLELAEFSINKSYEEVFWIDKDAKIIRVNDYACKMLGYKKEELLKMTVHDIDPVFTKDLWPKHWEDLKKNKSQVIKSIHKTKEGKEYPVEISINYLNYNGREYNFAYAKDISQRECALQRLKDAEEKYRTFLENLIGIYYKANINGIPVLFEGTVKDITGYDKEEFIKGLSWDKIIHPEDFKNMKDSWELLAKAPNTSVNREYRIIRKDGAVRWLHEITRNICENNKPKYLIGSLHDITEKRLIQDEIGQAKEDAEEYLEIAANIIVAI
ncbi:MAG: PAS domain S-box protein, partial [Nanoarchaeota archaeon]|nr:PAS domain S-box protein [Nanoarchaeota archaeon]